MRFVATKTPEQESCLMLHRTRDLQVRMPKPRPSAAPASSMEVAALRLTAPQPSFARTHHRHRSVGQHPGPNGAEVVDYTGKTIIPGLISDHSHVGIFIGLKAAPENYNRD